MAKARGLSWQREETLDLLALWGESKIQELLRQSHRNIDVFQDVAKGMLSRGHQRSAEECRSKTKTLRQMYKKVVASNSKSGNNRVTCPFYEQLHNILRGRADVWPRRVAHSLVIEYEDPPNDQNAVQGDRECSCPSEILDSQGDLDSSMAGAMPMDLEGPVDIVEGADSEETMLEMINEPGTPVRNEDAVVVEEHDSPERDPDGIAPGSAVSELTPKSRLALIRARKKRVSAMQKIGEQMMAQATQEYTGMMEAVRQEHVEFVNEMRETRMEERESREALLQILQSTAKSLSDISSALLRSGGRVGWRSNNLRSRATVSRRQPLLPPSSDEQTTWPVLCTETQEEGLGQEGVTLTLVVPETATELVAEAASVSLDSANPGGSPIQNRPRRALKRKLRYSPQH